MQTVKSRFESWLGGTSLCKGSQAYLCMKQHVYMAPCLNDVCRIMQCKQACNLWTPHKGSIPWKRGARTQACCLVGSRCSQLHLHLRSSAVKRRPGSHQRWCCEVTGPPAHPCAHAQALQPAHHCLHHSIATWNIRGKTGKTTPFGVNSMRKQVFYRAAQHLEYQVTLVS